MAVRFMPKIDTIVYYLKNPPHDYMLLFNEQLDQWKASKNWVGLAKLMDPSGKCSVINSKWSRIATIKVRKTAVVAQFEVGGRYDKTLKKVVPFAKWTIHRGQITDEEFLRFQQVWSAHYSDADYTWVVKHARVSRIDYAVDLGLVEPLDLLPHRSRLRNSTWFDSEKHSLYLGTRHSNWMLNLYDKKQQLQAVKGIASLYPRTRVEVRVKYPANGKTSGALHAVLATVKNPFNELEVADFNRAILLDPSYHWQAFLNECDQRGSAYAMSQLGPNARTQVKEKLKLVAASFWNPVGIWECAAAMFTKVMPVSV